MDSGEISIKTIGSDDYKYKKLIHETIQEIPDEDIQEKVEDKVRFVICEGIYGHTTSIKISEIYQKNNIKKIGSKKLYCSEHDIIILNFEAMEGKSEDFKKYKIAHEIAHYHLGHKGFGKPGNEEAEADKLAQSWGFKKVDK